MHPMCVQCACVREKPVRLRYALVIAPTRERYPRYMESLQSVDTCFFLVLFIFIITIIVIIIFFFSSSGTKFGDVQVGWGQGGEGGGVRYQSALRKDRPRVWFLKSF